jgi:hypothetical protein
VAVAAAVVGRATGKGTKQTDDGSNLLLKNHFKNVLRSYPMSVSLNQATIKSLNVTYIK